MAQIDAAYNFEYFSDKKQHFSVVKTRKKKKCHLVKWSRFIFKLTAVSLLFVLSITLMIAQIKLFELTGQINKEQIKIEKLNADYEYFYFQSLEKMDLRKVESYAQNKLGMVKMAAAQTVFVTPPAKPQINIKKSELEKKWEYMKTAIEDLFGIVNLREKPSSLPRRKSVFSG